MSTDDTLRALRAEVVASPGDDTVRLAYADALDEAGTKGGRCRAKYIRLAVRMHAAHGPTWVYMSDPAGRLGVKWAEKAVRKFGFDWVADDVRDLAIGPYRHALFDAPTRSVGFTVLSYQSQWVTSAARSLSNVYGHSIHWCRLMFERGFLSRVEAHWPYVEHTASLLAAAEPISDVTVTTWYGSRMHTRSDGSVVPARDAFVDSQVARLKGLLPAVVNWTFPP